MNDYYLVIGSTKRDKIEPFAIKKLEQHFSIINESKVYIGKSEGDSKYPTYYNIGVYIQSDVPYSDIKKTTKEIEESVNNIIDIDIVLQKRFNKIQYISQELTSYCHCLITLNDLIPNEIINDKSIRERFLNHSNNHFFKEVYKPCNINPH